MSKNIFLLSGLLMLSCLLKAFPVVHADCKQQIEKAFEAEKDFIRQTFSSNQCWFLNYTMITEIKNPETNKYETARTNGELWATKEVRLVKTNSTEVLMDSKDVFTVNRSQKKVIRTRSSKDFFKKNADMYNNVLKDSLMKQFTITSCSQLIEKKGDTLIQYVFEPLHIKKAIYSKMVFYISSRSLAFKKMYFELNPALSEDTKSYTMIINERSQKKIDDEWKHISSKFVDSKGRLQKTYLGYTYKDLTQ